MAKRRPRAKQDNDFPVVGIGASAGGLEALENLVSHIPPNPGLAFVIIQHLDPKHPSMMVSLLQKHTKMSVLEIKDGMKVKTNCVYLNPPNRNVTIVKHILRLAEPVLPARGTQLPIDHFFRSLAADMKEKAICVVLSGTGSDGSLGLKAVKGEGGITLAQDVRQAKYDGMPQSAIDTGFVDLVLPVEKMPRELIKYAGHPYLKEAAPKPSEAQRFTDVINHIFAVVRKATGIDFTSYKQNTIRRRIERRMALGHIETHEEYAAFLKSNPAEVEQLYKDLLIKVTSFFRDPQAFNVLQEEVIPRILECKPPGSSIRVWVPACATGEEAYSIAMLFQEAIDQAKQNCEVHIFATDIDMDAISFARQAIYADNIAADVSPQRLGRFFTYADGKYKVKKLLRETVVFAAQNIIKDPPFSRLDLISCRNMLIYMDSSLQKKLLPLFHYVLNPGGFLFLGSSESIGEFADLFSAVNLKWKLFKRKGVAIEHRIDLHKAAPGELAAETVKARHEASGAEPTMRRLAETIILDNYAPTCVLINEKYDILYVNGHTEQFLSLAPGEPTYNILRMAHDEVRFKLNTLLHKAFKEKRQVVAEDLPLRMNGNLRSFNLIVRPVAVPGIESQMAMVIFDAGRSAAKTATQAKKKKTGKSSATDTRISELEQELASTKEYLQTTIEELETSNEELKSTNEELQSTNEEFQSTNEELETSREELQSTNEELETVNSELQNKVAEMLGVNNDVTNLLNSMDVAAIFLDSDLHIRRYTASAAGIFSLIPTDLGRSLGDIVHKITRPDLFGTIRQVLKDLTPLVEEVRTTDYRWLLMSIRPYQTGDNVVDGTVITFVDITRLRHAELAATAAEATSSFAASIINTLREPFLVLDEKLTVISANESFYRFFHTASANTEGRFVYELGDGQWNIPQLRRLLEEILPRNNKFEDFEVEHDFAAIGRKKMLLNARQVFDNQTSMPKILLAFEDITEKN
jgi:two-component system, chemotaxis family, CheB/CheR fusion protein